LCNWRSRRVCRSEFQQVETNGAALYDSLADAEKDSRLSEVYRRLANVERKHAERWRHVHGCARYFNALRDTTTDQFLTTYRCGEPRPALPPGAAT